MRWDLRQAQNASWTARRGARRTALRRGATVLTLVLILVGLSTQQAQAAPASQLTNDASGPLFPTLTLLPGEQSTACIAISYKDTEPGPAIGLFAAGVSGNLAPFLRIRIESGSGGRYGDCTGFAGREIFAGTLLDLSARHGSAQHALRTARLDGQNGTISYRFSLGLADDNRAQGRSAQAAFTWVTPAAPASTGGAAGPSTTTRTKAATAPVPHGSTGTQLNGDGPAHAGSTTTTGPSAIADLAEVTKRALLAVARGSVVSLLGLGLVMIFLAVHSRIDRRDEKLANAPLTPTFLSFDTPSGPRGTA